MILCLTDEANLHITLFACCSFLGRSLWSFSLYHCHALRIWTPHEIRVLIYNFCYLNLLENLKLMPTEVLWDNMISKRFISLTYAVQCLIPVTFLRKLSLKMLFETLLTHWAILGAPCLNLFLFLYQLEANLALKLLQMAFIWCWIAKDTLTIDLFLFFILQLFNQL